MTGDAVPVAVDAVVVGRVIAGVPRGGYGVVFLHQPTGAASVMCLALTLWLSWGLFFPKSAPARPVLSG